MAKSAGSMDPNYSLYTIFSLWLLQWFITVLICITLLLLVTREFYCKSGSSRHINLSIRRLSVLYFLLYTFAFVCFVVNTATEIAMLSTPISQRHTQDSLDGVEDTFWSIGLTFGGLSQVAFYALLMIRLYNTFQDTTYRVSHLFYYGYSIAIGISFLSGSMYLLSVQGEVHYLWRVIFLSITGGMFICIRLSLIWMFVHKLINLSAQRQAVVHPSLHMVMAQSHSMNSRTNNNSFGSFHIQVGAVSPTSMSPTLSSSSNNSNNSNNFSPVPPPNRTPRAVSRASINRTVSGRECALLVTITKQTVLGTFAITSGLVALLVLGIERTVRDPDDDGANSKESSYGVFTYFAIALAGWSVWIEMLCVYLGYSFNQSRYFSMCNRCHDMCAMEVTDVRVRKRSSAIRIAKQRSAEFENKVKSSHVTTPPLPQLRETVEPHEEEEEEDGDGHGNGNAGNGKIGPYFE